MWYRWDVKRISVVIVALVGCSKAPSENKQPSGSAAPVASAGSGSATGLGSAAAAEPSEAATVVGPTKSASGTIAVTGKITGSFDWKKKDQRAPISCAWDPEKEIGGVRVDLSDGAGHLLTVQIDVPPSELGPARLDVVSKDLLEPQNTHVGFKVKGDEEGHITVKFDHTAMPEVLDAKKKATEGAPAIVTLDGTLEVTCPKKK